MRRQFLAVGAIFLLTADISIGLSHETGRFGFKGLRYVTTYATSGKQVRKCLKLAWIE